MKALDYRTKVTVLSALFAVLTVTAVLGWVFSQQAVNQRQAQETLVPGYQASTVSGLELGNGVVLTKGASWALTYQGKAYPASNDRVETYLKTLGTQLRERLVTTGDPKPFGLDQGYKTLKLLGPAGKVLADLQVGSANELGDKVYVRLAGQKEIWQTDRGFARTLDLDFNTWADLSLFPGKKAADLVRISFDSRIETADKTVYAPFDLEKSVKDGKTRWENRVNKVSLDTMGTWAELVPTVHAGAFVAPGDAAASPAVVGTVTLNWADGSTTSLKLSPPDTQNRYRITEGQRELWLNDWALGQLLYK